MAHVEQRHAQAALGERQPQRPLRAPDVEHAATGAGQTDDEVGEELDARLVGGGDVRRLRRIPQLLDVVRAQAGPGRVVFGVRQPHETLHPITV